MQNGSIGKSKQALHPEELGNGAKLRRKSMVTVGADLQKWQ